MNKKITGLALTAVLVFAGIPAGAQAQNASAAMRACAKISSAVARLDCYDRAARAESGEGAQAGQSEPPQAHDAPAPAPAPVRSGPAAGQSGSAAPQQSASAPSARPADKTPPQPEAAASSPPEAAASSGPAVAEASSPPAAAASSREPAAHDQNAKAGGNDEFEVTIVKIRRIRQRTEVFLITDDGHVWRQTDDRQIVFPHTPFRAVISSGFLGSHFLSPVGERFSIHVSDQR